MGELILCNQMLAALPYYIDEAGIGIYSLEELSYYIENNLYLLESDFMNEELCTWIDKELKLTQTAAILHDIYRRDGTLSEFVECILKQSGYLSVKQIHMIVTTLENMEHKTEFQRIKMRADRYVENQRYINAIYEYRKLFGMKSEANEMLVGDVWHNLGCAYAGLFLFREAAECYKQAYQLNNNHESLRECLYSYRCMRDETRFLETAASYGVSEDELLDIKKMLNEISRMDDIREFEQHIEELFQANLEEDISEIVSEWKDTYRKNCKL